MRQGSSRGEIIYSLSEKVLRPFRALEMWTYFNTGLHPVLKLSDPFRAVSVFIHSHVLICDSSPAGAAYLNDGSNPST